MVAQNDIEAAIGNLEDGTTEERVETLGALANLSHSQADALVPYLDDICSLASNENQNVRSYVATILSNIARHDPSIMADRGSVVRTLLTDDDPHVLTFATAAVMKIASASPEALLSETDRLFELLTYKNAQATGAARSTRKRAKRKVAK